MNFSPYPGLRPFASDEAEYFFGREEHVEWLLQKLRASRFVAVVGPSGCGKSSLVKAGLIPFLKSGFMENAGPEWSIVEMRPGNKPMATLAESLIHAITSEDDSGIPKDNFSLVLANLRRGPLGLIEVLNESAAFNNSNILLLIDQFEEIFRYRREFSINEAEAFVNLLLASADQEGKNVYVIITMRSDFLGDCAVFNGLPETMNDSQFLTPRLTRDQLRAAITGPAGIVGANVELQLVNRLLNEINDEPDQLPVFQHALMRMWSKTSRSGFPDTERLTLTISDYDAIGGLGGSLSNHIDEAFNELNDNQVNVAKKMFRCLCDRGPDRRDTRRPVKLGNIAEICGISTDKVKEVVEVFRSLDRCFMTPPQSVPLESNTILDISHESLIRQWKKLNQWVTEEAESGTVYTRLFESASGYYSDDRKSELYQGAELDYTLKWKRNERPSPAWAERYGGNFELAMKFLDVSVEERKKIECQKEEARRKELENQKKLTAAEKERAEAEKQRAATEKQRAEEQAKAAKKFKRLAAVLALILLIAVLAASYAFIQRKIAIIAQKKAERAFEMADIARKAKTKALVKEEKAKQQAKDALTRAEKAHEELKVALDNETNAKVAAQEAKIKTESALNKLQEALLEVNTSRKAAEMHQTKADYEREKAEDSKEEAEYASELAEMHQTKADYEREKAEDSKEEAEYASELAEESKEEAEELQTAYRFTSLSLKEVERDPTIALRIAENAKSLESSKIITDSIYKIYQENEFYSQIISHCSSILSVRFSTDGSKVQTISENGKSQFWSLKGKPIEPFESPKIILSNTPRVTSTISKMTLTGGEDGIVQLLDKNNNLLKSFKGHQDRINCVAFSPDGKSFITGSDDQTARIWVLNSNLQATIKENNSPILSLDVDPEGKFIVSGSDAGTIVLRDMKRYSPVFSFHFSGKIRSIAFNQDEDQFLVSPYKNDPELWDVDGSLLQIFSGHLFSVRSVEFSPDCKQVLTGSDDGTAHLWDLYGNRLETFGGHEGSVYSAAFSPDGKTILTGSEDSKVRLWSVKNGETIQTLSVHKSSVLSVDFSPFGRFFVTGSKDQTALLWNSDGSPALSQDLKSQIKMNHSGAVRTTTFSPDGRFILTGSDDSHIRLWNYEGQLVRLYRGHQGAVRTLKFAPDGETFASGSDDQTIRIWKTSPELDEFLVNGPLAQLTEETKKDFEINNN